MISRGWIDKINVCNFLNIKLFEKQVFNLEMNYEFVNSRTTCARCLVKIISMKCDLRNPILGVN